MKNASDIFHFLKKKLKFSLFSIYICSYITISIHIRYIYISTNCFSFVFIIFYYI